MRNGIALSPNDQVCLLVRGLSCRTADAVLDGLLMDESAKSAYDSPKRSSWDFCP